MGDRVNFFRRAPRLNSRNVNREQQNSSEAIEDSASRPHIKSHISRTGLFLHPPKNLFLKISCIVEIGILITNFQLSTIMCTLVSD